VRGQSSPTIDAATPAHHTNPSSKPISPHPPTASLTLCLSTALGARHRQAGLNPGGGRPVTTATGPLTRYSRAVEAQTPMGDDGVRTEWLPDDMGLHTRALPPPRGEGTITYPSLLPSLTPPVLLGGGPQLPPERGGR
jgi:hypothetical protein